MKKTFAVIAIVLFMATSFIFITAVQPNTQTQKTPDFSTNTISQTGEVQIYSSHPDTVFPQLLNSVSGYIINSTSYGYVLQINFELKYKSILNRYHKTSANCSLPRLFAYKHHYYSLVMYRRQPEHMDRLPGN